MFVFIDEFIVQFFQLLNYDLTDVMSVWDILPLSSSVGSFTSALPLEDSNTG